VLRPGGDAEALDMEVIDPPDPDPNADARSPMRLLEAGIPLSLILDLMSPFGPDSAGIIAAERWPERVTPLSEMSYCADPRRPSPRRF